MNWNRTTNSPGWYPKIYLSSVVYDNKIWVIGGDNYINDVWYSTDGVNWTCATSSTEWYPYGHTTVNFDNKMWLMGDHVWYSTNGITWFQVTDTSEWKFRSYHTSVVFNNKIWVLGGGDNDVWYWP